MRCCFTIVAVFAVLALCAAPAPAQEPAATTLIAVGLDQGPPVVKTFDQTLEPTGYFSAFHHRVQGARVAVGDVNNDGVLDVIVGAGHGGRGEVKVVDGNRLNDIDERLIISSGALLGDFFAFGRGFRGDVNVGSGDVTGDGYDDVIVGAGPGGRPTVRVYDGARLAGGHDLSGRGSLIASFDAFDSHFRGGVSVAAGDVNGDGRADIIVGARSKSVSSVNVFDGAEIGVGGHGHSLSRLLAQPKIIAILIGFLAYDASFTGGVLVSTAKVESGSEAIAILTGPSTPGDGTTKLFAGTPTDAPAGAAIPKPIYVKIDNIAELPIFGPQFIGGVRVAAADLDGDGVDEIFGAANAGSGPEDTINIAKYDANAEGGLIPWSSFEPFTSKGVKVEPTGFTGTGLFVGAKTLRVLADPM